MASSLGSDLTKSCSRRSGLVRGQDLWNKFSREPNSLCWIRHISCPNIWWKSCEEASVFCDLSAGWSLVPRLHRQWSLHLYRRSAAVTAAPAPGSCCSAALKIEFYFWSSTSWVQCAVKFRSNIRRIPTSWWRSFYLPWARRPEAKCKSPWRFRRLIKWG